MQRSWECWNLHQNERHAIFYQTIGFCPQTNCIENQDIYSFIKREANSKAGDKPLYSSNDEDINKYLEQELTSTINGDLPKEWTVIQLCKNFNPMALSRRHDDIMSFNTSISMTIFKQSAVNDMLMIELNNHSSTNENLYEKVFALNKKISETLGVSKMPQDTTPETGHSNDKYWKARKDLETYVQDTVNLLKAFFGPWVCALTGVFKSRKSMETENEIRKKVQEFLKKRNFNEQQQKIIHIIARRTDLLSAEQIFLAITYVLRDKPNLGYEDIDLNNLYDHLTWIKQEFVYDDVSTHPCILIVDDLLDQMPFEMLNTNQEFTRMCSFKNLKRLYERYRDSMENGYILSPTANCQAVINPDGTLKLCEERMKNFFNYWLPSWKITSHLDPTKDEIQDILAQTDAMAYCGHGSGLHLSCYENVYNLKTKAIVFLFGCSSVALSSTGLNSEMKGAHVYYHMGWSPAVIGFLWSVTDFNTDYCSSKLLSAWCNPLQAKAHWQCIDKLTWRKNGNLGEFVKPDISSY